MPTVSVIVPNYNHARYLRQRIDSILAQTFQDFELILLDDCSTDESREILREYLPRQAGLPGLKAADAGEVVAGLPFAAQGNKPRASTGVDVNLAFNEVNSGSTFKQWNKGVRLARGKYMWIAESDDYAEPRFLERLVTLLEADERVVIAYCRSHRVVMLDAGAVVAGQEQVGRAGEARADGRDCIVDGYGDPLLPAQDLARWTADFCAEGMEECRRYFAMANLVRNASSAVFRKDAYEAAGGADENLRLCGDWKLWAGVSLQGKMVYVSEPLNYYRLHGGSVWGTSVDGTMEIEEVLHVVRWVMEQARPTDAVREKMCKRLSLGWVMALMRLHVSLERKKKILRDVRAIDSHPMRRVLRPAVRTIGMKMRRHWRELRAMAARIGTAP